MTASRPRTALAPPDGNNTATLPAEALSGLLGDLERTISDDDLMPMLRGIMLHTESIHAGDNKLYATSTDRYILAQGWEPATGALPPVYLDRESIGLARTVLRAAASGQVHLHVNEAHEMTLHVDYVGSLLLFTTKPAFPHLATLVADMSPTESSGKATLAPDYLYKLGEIGERRKFSPVLTFGEPKRPSSIQIGPRYHALLMPIDLTPPAPFQYHFPVDGDG